MTQVDADSLVRWLHRCARSERGPDAMFTMNEFAYQRVIAKIEAGTFDVGA
jgi:hypothetical protein